ncbi:hypothetical protein KAFR_0H02460 [Kazachstania africana CBS 2517]|uniref:Ribosome biogenesis protein NOP53 n=1 Tax=Kazachstania africana (strain ATCC 22294 / BCRC 22015 / CBS 2517 / CECT 1963 / NBRC 1671 / NRRL Y-8276) TaxID=1071382 RepID=H2AZ99_KAZAF|nr:hypothetical protein KAFR_0H02460 [Kazachstania africana CBS 2517]CCF59655.1 hypothetical protein KAFR_0H02460 [Kazachstania africana CBS 2517]
MAPQPAAERPAQYRQKSRKGKKAWRKNIDLTEIEKSVAMQREHEITHGTENIADLKDDLLFQVDEDGDKELKSKLIKRKQIKKVMKSTEILDSIKTNSKVNALMHPKQNTIVKSNKIQGVSKHELTKLMALAGRVHGESKLKSRSAKDGLVKSDSFDLWGSDDKKQKQIELPSGIRLDVDSKDQVPKELLTKSTTSWSKPSVAPATMSTEPVKIRDFDAIPHAGKSYNADKKAWANLLNKEYEVEKVKEEKRIALEQYRERIKHLMATLDDNEEESSSESDNEQEEDIEGDEIDTDSIMKLSVNEPVKNKKKTKYQRNKAKKHEEKVKLQQELNKLKEQVRELEKVEEFEEEIAQKSQPTKTSKKQRKLNRNKLGTKYGILDERLEIKFSDELSDSLRKLKPEGNLLYDNVRKLQSSGVIESRVPVKQGRRYKQKITEKWTYKDFK